MGRGTPCGAVELEDDLEPGDGYTPFFMVYGIEEVLPTYLDYGAPRVMMYKEQEAKEFLEGAMDQLDEARDVALLRSARY
jgi:hypothetical protein